MVAAKTTTTSNAGSGTFWGMTGSQWKSAGAAVGVVSSGVGGILGGLASYQSAKVQSKLLLSQAKSQAWIASKNIESLHKNTGLQLRLLEDERVSAEANTRASIAAAGIRQDSQTAQDIFARQEREIAREQWAIRQQAIEQTCAMQLESRLNTISLTAQAKMTKAAGKANMVSSILGGIGSAASFAMAAA